jgi:hypothetical protein
MNELSNRIAADAKNTLGYLEAVDKRSFTTGAEVALCLSEEHYQKEIDSLQRQLNSYKVLYENTLSDFKTVSSIINRYSDNDL